MTSTLSGREERGGEGRRREVKPRGRK